VVCVCQDRTNDDIPPTQKQSGEKAKDTEHRKYAPAQARIQHTHTPHTQTFMKSTEGACTRCVETQVVFSVSSALGVFPELCLKNTCRHKKSEGTTPRHTQQRSTNTTKPQRGIIQADRMNGFRFLGSDPIILSHVLIRREKRIFD
jgi:hypothetical protein